MSLVRKLFEHAPARVQMWAHKKFGYEWLPAKLVAEALPVSVLYWAFIKVGVKGIRSNEVVPDVRYVDILKRIPVKKA